MIRLFVPQNLAPGLPLELSHQQLHYLLHVMRVKAGEKIFIFNGVDGEWVAQIAKVTKRSCTVETLTQSKLQPNEQELYLLFPPLKPKALEYLIEKATEVGATHLQPILTERGSVTRFNEDKAKLQAMEAAEQCGRLSIPHFQPLQSLQQILQTWPTNKPLFVGDETHSSPPLLSFQLKGELAFMVGPEGGWTTQELELFKKYSSIQTVDLGAYILRAETASVVGLSTIQQMQNLK